ncbi:hypothetical protein DESHY_60164 [Desulforamulus hydrothermalis Lam5 = DSM 18033]|uniref:Uncharacterized protein n=1 Tax=Desulforamulus hydrothermalis Lam5 = DSM 18033 TaxID=1121428 RepID=K8E0D3_9FIRM|nr:hypothetical protein DESHY_60164 [Desulforamulus hydrothermalis Lam5 = DSM 18033]
MKLPREPRRLKSVIIEKISKTLQNPIRHGKLTCLLGQVSDCRQRCKTK